MNKETPLQIIARFRVEFPAFQLSVDLTIPGRGVTAFFGSSGSGKTTLLRCLAGLERMQSGFLSINGAVWQDDASGVRLPTHRRPLGYVFQEASLFPHLSVKGNLNYGRSRIASTDLRVSLEHAIELLGLSALLERMPDRLSGGERQRVAIARALATSPRLLLMDEPLASLDMQRRDEILPYLDKLRSELEIPIIYVSHSPDELARFAEHVVLLDAGKIVAQGPLAEIFTRKDLPLAHRADAESVFDAVVKERDEYYALAYLETPFGKIAVPNPSHAVGQNVRIRIRAGDVSLALIPPSQSSILNIFAARITDIEDEKTGQMLVWLDAKGVPLLARITRKSADTLGLKNGLEVYVQVKGVALS